MLKLLCMFTIFFCTTGFTLAQNTVNPDWLYFIGLHNDEWKVFAKPLGKQLGKKRDFKILPTQSEPREVYFAAKDEVLYYLDASSQLRKLIIDSNEDKVLLQAKGKHSYAQPFVCQETGDVFMVHMPAGESSKADIVKWRDGTVSSVVRQLSSQFEPFLHDKKWLYFGNVHCSIDCGRIIQEVWRKNIISGESEQMTLLGNIARQPIIDAEGQWLYFSSNKTGHYQIWRQKLTQPHTKAEQVTDGDAQHIGPAVDGNNNLYFIRRLFDQATLIKKDTSGATHMIELPADISDIRNLRVNQ